VYTGEGYVRQEHSHRSNDDDNDDDDDDDTGVRYCFAAAIKGVNPVDPNDTAGLVPNSILAFCPKLKKVATTKEGFNSTNYVAWFKNQLLPNLKHKSIIIMDETSYHEGKAEGMPDVSKLTKTEVIAFLQEKGIAGAEDVNRSLLDLKEHAKGWIEQNVPMEVQRLANEKGHVVLFTPPYHSDLQPIELVCDRILGNVGRQHGSKEPNLELVHRRLMKEFEGLDTDEGRDYVAAVITKCSASTETLYNEMDLEAAS
jgi:transposase